MACSAARAQQAEEALKGVSGETDLARAQAELAEAEARYRAAQKLKGKQDPAPVDTMFWRGVKP